MALTAVALNCSLKGGPVPSSTDKLLNEVLTELGIKGEIVRVVDLNIKPGVTADEGEGDEWPALLKQILAADITIAACAGTYWVGEAMGSTDYKDLRKPYDKTIDATKMLVANAAHLAKLLKKSPYPGISK